MESNGDDVRNTQVTILIKELVASYYVLKPNMLQKVAQ